MAANESNGHTESKQTSSYKYVKKAAVQLEIKYKIEEFEALMNTTEPGKGDRWSEGVTSELAPRAVWKLRIYPNGWQHRGNVSIYLWLTGPMMNNGETQQASFHLYLVDGTGKIESIWCGSRSFAKEHYSWGSGEVSHERVKKALHEDGSLLVAADVEFLLPDECGAKSVSESVLQGYEDREQWATNFSELHDNEASSDCTIKIGGISIPAHKSILAAHSTIFNSMFTRPMSEEYQSGVVKVTDFMEPDPMRALIRYCYQGQLDTETMDGEGAVEIFKLADRYCIKELKALLERHFIEKRLSAKNVVAMAVLADAHSATKLKEACIKLIASEGSAVFEIDEWKERSDGELIAEVFQLADKYSIAELKDQLEKHFVDERVIVENVLTMAVLADSHSAPKLEKACIKLIAQEWKTVSASAVWNELVEANSKLAVKLAAGAATLLAEK